MTSSSPVQASPKLSIIESLFQSLSLQNNRPLPSSTSSTSQDMNSHQPQLKEITPLDLRTIEAFTGPLGRRNHAAQSAGDWSVQDQTQIRPATTRVPIQNSSQSPSTLTEDLEAQVPSDQNERPSIREVTQKNPKDISFTSILLAVLCGIIIGWIVFLNRMNRRDETLIMVGNACFIVLLLIDLALLIRQTLKIISIFYPPSTSENLGLAESGMTCCNGTCLPSYVASVGRRHITDDVGGGESQSIVGDSPPKYGDQMGHELLLTSRSREIRGPEERHEGWIEVFYQSHSREQDITNSQRQFEVGCERRGRATRQGIRQDAVEGQSQALQVQIEDSVDEQSVDHGEVVNQSRGEDPGEVLDGVLDTRDK
ncbi:uncharacterized protein IL334_002909 [Kwoniella shivajii]|uniref:Uncharacterized protein n=1 Tax=Kwoniella shivajii TaxID=564305 RepID=A0ABZ1CW24_9TREE|nr:hypothetical protein IL334_002909 [Kwoniella shivajii]